MICANAMRRVSCGLLVVCTALSFGFLASDARAQEEPDCSAPTVQSDLNACAEIEYEKADEELNTAYKEVRKAMADWDDNVDDAGKGAVNALVAAQRAWVSFRDANCEAAGFQARGGSMEPMLVSGCLADMSNKRAAELRQFLEGF